MQSETTVPSESLLPERSKEVARHLRSAGVTGEIREMPGSTRTAADAAAALGCDPGAIASSLVFLTGDEPVLVLTSGRHRVDTDALVERLGWQPLTRAKPEQVRRVTGQAIGGVAPLGHPRALPTVVDSALADYERVWAAGGTPRTVFPTTHDELVRMTGGRSLPVGSDD
ncbi:Cys-tRNA(Pro) deacylase, prolyl-tRNA editing enzyme YbaK/EbsC [Actinopolyspora xinjiangensis]|uniref:Cys-tRNA(Pro) deacylase, prolyl-tRNA editing enzyme YbaK/EbsC n=1 Tax=Actinopolyspora xinjiangensis TaxID=405564 RepID=A0A1H0WR20_9ACTN|nr:YbaK/EbsC family protein [Actinopolyspora xinjiangensis]SDP93144.1 Cys-tRNA(Pro) deacylase, prolyl-tRNA editing enzyme YbaK/EbsC [Actinopolyspora xinjiangensis]